jgi:hypothetical protein
MTKYFIQLAIVLWFTLLLGYNASAQPETLQPIDTVYQFIAGSGQNTGQQPDFFPANIFGLPATTASATTPATLPKDICSMGLGGEITVGFKNGVLLDRPGADFIIFENAFDYAFGRRYAEPAKVSVSSNGVDFILFPYDSLSLQGCAGVQPTIATQPFSPDSCGGDRFDLATIGMDSIRFIRITDISSIIINNPSHPFWDVTPVSVNDKIHHKKYNIHQKTFYPMLEAGENILIYNVHGQLLHQTITSPYIFPRHGVYFIIVNTKNKIHREMVFVEE